MGKAENYELALAMPVITSGIRTASVMIIGTATLAALIGAGGLGSFILLGIDHNDSALILIGAGSSAFSRLFQLRHPYTRACLIKKVFSCTMFLYIGSHAFFRLFFPPA